VIRAGDPTNEPRRLVDTNAAQRTDLVLLGAWPERSRGARRGRDFRPGKRYHVRVTAAAELTVEALARAEGERARGQAEPRREMARSRLGCTSAARRIFALAADCAGGEQETGSEAARQARQRSARTRYRIDVGARLRRKARSVSHARHRGRGPNDWVSANDSTRESDNDCSILRRVVLEMRPWSVGGRAQKGDGCG
jgi:hypothetical protein